VIELDKSYVLLGSGGHATSILDLLESCGISKIYVCGLTNDQKISKYDTISTEEIEKNLDDLQLVLAIGDQKLRSDFMSRNSELMKNGRFPVLIHPSAFVSPSSDIGSGTIVFAHSYIGPFCSIGNFSIINTHSVVEHGNKLGESVILSPRVTLCGNVSVGNNTFLGLGVGVAPSVEIGANVTIGAFSFVNKSLKQDSKVYGIPAVDIA
jgi:sugar O-acyltransferase (sialic acid O-acetyltransferase NeuD family)